MERLDIEENSVSAKEYKKFVSQAVKFVIGHTRNGFVSLCAGVATLMQEKASLELENESLRQQIEELKQSCIIKTCSLSKESMLISCEKNPESITSNLEQLRNILRALNIKKREHFKTYKAIKGCLCNNCARKFLNSEQVLTPPLKKGDRVIISDEICGSVAYIGHVDELDFPEIFVGLHLDESVGDNNGTIKDKTYFKAPHHYGYFVPLSKIVCIIN